jgi:hypothetical protein
MTRCSSTVRLPMMRIIDLDLINLDPDVSPSEGRFARRDIRPHDPVEFSDPPA